MPRECDVVVIGAGVAGLTSAALLSKAGLRVVVVEAQPRPGGYLCGFKRRGFRFDSSVVWLNQCAPGGLAHRMFRHLGDDFPRCKPLERIRRYKGESFDYLLTSDPSLLRDRLMADFPREAANVQRFFQDAKALGDRWQLLSNRFRSTESMSLWEKSLYGTKMLHWVLPVRKFLGLPAEDGLRRYFGEGSEVSKIFCSESEFMSAILPIGWAYMSDYQAPPVGGIETFITWLASRVETSGSQVLLGRAVEKILVEGRRARGVMLDGGEPIHSRYVLAACDVEALYERMLDPGLVPAKLLEKLRVADLYSSHVTVFLGLDCDTSDLGLGEELVTLTRGDVSRAEHSGGDPHKTSMVVVAPSVRDPSLAPRGKGTLTIECPAWISYKGYWKADAGMARGERYQKLKQDFAKILIERVEQSLVPQLRQHIELTEVATPLTYERYTGNRDGSIMGATPSSRNIRSGIAHYRTSVDNLLLAGHWAEYGGGVPVAIKAATNASSLVLRDINPSAFETLIDVMEGRRSPCG